MTTTIAPTTTYGVHSEVGKLRKVMVCKPGLAHLRLTPENCHDLLFDDVIWVQNARRDHFDFVSKMRERGVEVVELHNLLTETLAIGEAKKWLLDRKIIANEVGLGRVDDTRSWRLSDDRERFDEERIDPADGAAPRARAANVHPANTANTERKEA